MGVAGSWLQGRREERASRGPLGPFSEPPQPLNSVLDGSRQELHLPVGWDPQRRGLRSLTFDRNTVPGTQAGTLEKMH